MQFDKVIYTIKLSISALFACLFGGFDPLLELLCIAMAVDFLSGLLLAVIYKKSTKTRGGALSSDVAVKGVIRKVCQLFLVMLITKLGTAIGDSYFCRNTAIIFFIANEGISILENMGLMGVPYPEWLKSGLDVLLEKSQKK